MLFCDLFLLCAIGWQISGVVLFFENTNPPPILNSGKFSDADFLFLVSNFFKEVFGLCVTCFGFSKLKRSVFEALD